jgi:hypothetical protein
MSWEYYAPGLDRVRVDGGYLYRYSAFSKAAALQFVPDSPGTVALSLERDIHDPADAQH